MRVRWGVVALWMLWLLTVTSLWQILGCSSSNPCL